MTDPIDSEIADILHEERVVEIVHDGGGFRITELCDECFSEWLTPQQLRQFGRELITAADKQIEKNAS